ncbi:hypothetical protein EDD86DRAFT_272574 [Gorgonomyces haynaldii]|nr:hypothetical protein EDD86DRAFT_272574 [Gorgonomyces haynaldii]
MNTYRPFYFNPLEDAHRRRAFIPSSLQLSVVNEQEHMKPMFEEKQGATEFLVESTNQFAIQKEDPIFSSEFDTFSDRHDHFAFNHDYWPNLEYNYAEEMERPSTTFFYNEQALIQPQEEESYQEYDEPTLGRYSGMAGAAPVDTYHPENFHFRQDSFQYPEYFDRQRVKSSPKYEEWEEQSEASSATPKKRKKKASVGSPPKKAMKRQKHVGKACVHCKKAHLACDNARPCKRCVHLGKSDCVDVEHKRRGRPRATHTKKQANRKSSEEIAFP